MPLAFALPEDASDLAQALEAAEPQAPKAIKPLLIEAARALRDVKGTANVCAEVLEIAASLKAGQMASQSRHDEIAAQIRASIVDVAVRLRALA